jgi:Methyltransferase domain
VAHGSLPAGSRDEHEFYQPIGDDMDETSPVRTAGTFPTPSGHRYRPRFRHWLLKAMVQKALSILPGGRIGNTLLQQHLTKSQELNDARFELALQRCRKHLESYFAIRGHSQGGFSVLELGTGWYPLIPIGMYLCGASDIWTFDVEPLLSPERTRIALRFFSRYAQRGTLTNLLTWIEAGRLRFLLDLAQRSEGSTVSEILQPIQIYPVVGDASKTKLRSGSIDFFFSNATLQYVPEEAIAALFREFRRLAAPSAGMSHFISTRDDFAFFDVSITSYNFLKFSDATWRLFAGAIHSQNRLRPSDYKRLHKTGRWTISAEDSIQGCPEDLRRVDLAEKFREYSQEDLLCLETWLTSQCN